MVSRLNALLGSVVELSPRILRVFSSMSTRDWQYELIDLVMEGYRVLRQILIPTYFAQVFWVFLDAVRRSFLDTLCSCKVKLRYK